MAEYTVYTSTITGETVTPVTPANGDTFANSGSPVIVVENGSGSTVYI
jgi:hypothetical protein